MMSIVINNNFFSIHYTNGTDYDAVKSTLNNEKNNLIQKNNFYYQGNDEDQTITFFYKNNGKILYEEFEKLLYHLMSTLKVIPKELFDNAIKSGVNILDSNKFLFMTNNQRKFIIEFEGSNLVFNPIFGKYFESNSDLYEYYKDLFKIALHEIEGFARTRIYLENKKLYVNYYDAIDQFFYLIQVLISSKTLFDQNFDIYDYMQHLACFIVKNIANRELQNLNVDCSYNHPLNNFRYMTLITYKLFAKLTFDGSIMNLGQNDIEQIADAITYSNDFANAPSIISKAYENLNKALPFKTIEKILKRQRNVEYLF